MSKKPQPNPAAKDSGVLPPEQRGTVFILNPDANEWSLTNQRTGAEMPLYDFKPRRPTITIDVGHGYHKFVDKKNFRGWLDDPGAQRIGKDGKVEVRESELTLAYSKKLAKELTDRGYDVILTRGDNSFPQVFDGFIPRTDARHFAQGPLISMHVDSTSPSLSGPFVMVDRRSPAGGESHRLRQVLERNYPGDLLDGPGPKISKGLAIGNPENVGRMQPSVLVELGNLANDADAKRLQDPAYQQRMARELARDIDRYMEEREARRGTLDRQQKAQGLRDTKAQGILPADYCADMAMFEKRDGKRPPAEPTHRASGARYDPDGWFNPVIDYFDPPVTPKDPCKPSPKAKGR